MTDTTPSYVLKSKKYLQNRLPGQEVRFVESYKSFITGLKYHKYTEIPSKNRIYLCLHEKANKFDDNAIGIYASQVRIGFMPKHLAQTLAPMMYQCPDSSALLCYCFGNTTPISSQCVYNFFHVTPTKNYSERASAADSKLAICYTHYVGQ
jgi:hypothetical protein